MAVYLYDVRAPSGSQPDAVADFLTGAITHRSRRFPQQILLRTVFDYSGDTFRDLPSFLHRLSLHGHDCYNPARWGVGLSAYLSSFASKSYSGSDVIWARSVSSAQPRPFQKRHGRRFSGVLVLDPQGYTPEFSNIYVQLDPLARREALLAFFLVEHSSPSRRPVSSLD